MKAGLTISRNKLPLEGIEYIGGRLPEGFWTILLVCLTVHLMILCCLVKWF